MYLHRETCNFSIFQCRRLHRDFFLRSRQEKLDRIARSIYHSRLIGLINVVTRHTRCVERVNTFSPLFILRSICKPIHPRWTRHHCESIDRDRSSGSSFLSLVSVTFSLDLSLATLPCSEKAFPIGSTPIEYQCEPRPPRKIERSMCL